MTICGTDRGYEIHRRGGGKACRECLAAHSKAVKLRKVRKGRAYVSAHITAAHVAHLREQGMTISAISRAAGVCPALVKRVSTARRVKVHTQTALLSVHVDPSPGATVPRVGTVRRIQALQAIGWTHAAMEARCGFSTSCWTSRHTEHVTVRVAEGVAAMYEELSMTPGPSLLTRARAERFGYAPPLAWDDDGQIDDPNAQPDLGQQTSKTTVDLIAIGERIAQRPVPLNEAEVREAVWELDARGMTSQQIARRLGQHERTVQRIRARRKEAA